MNRQLIEISNLFLQEVLIWFKSPKSLLQNVISFLKVSSLSLFGIPPFFSKGQEGIL